MKWYYQDKDGQVVGPISESSLRDLQAAGVLADDSKVCREGPEDWTPLARAIGGEESEKPTDSPRFKFSCPHCDQHIAAEASDAGRSTRCPTCREKIVVPEAQKDPEALVPGTLGDPPEATNLSEEDNSTPEKGSGKGTAHAMAGRLTKGAKEGWSGIKRHSKIVALHAQVAKLRNKDLRKAHHALGKRCNELGLLEDSLASSFDAIREVEARIAADRQSEEAPDDEKKYAALKRVTRQAAKTSHAQALNLKLQHLLTELGRLAYPHNEQGNLPGVGAEVETIGRIQSLICGKEQEVTRMGDDNQGGWTRKPGTLLILAIVILGSLTYLGVKIRQSFHYAALCNSSANDPFINSIGMKFTTVSVIDEGDEKKVLFSIWETRVDDFSVFVEKSGFQYANGKNPAVLQGGKPVYKAVDGWKNPGFQQTGKHPVTCVSWHDAVAFCKWITEKERTSGTIPSNAEYRLPTDAEWSWAVGIGELEQKQGFSTPEKMGDRDENSGIYPFGAWPPPNRVGNFGDTSWRNARGGNVGWLNSAGSLYEDGFAFTSPVGSYPANRLGLFDLAGNVTEWCEDSYDGKPKYRTLRGGSWNDFLNSGLRSYWRAPDTPDNRLVNIGFRCVLAECK